MVQPYTQQYISEYSFRRIFNESVDAEELVWHRDRKTRTIKIIKSNGWEFQQDNKLPVLLKEGDIINVNAFEYHRILKGDGELIVEITEHEA